jgi:hypothetical protein
MEWRSSSASRSADSATATPSGIPYMSERQLDAYLLARDTVRRIQRVSPLMAALPIDRAKSASGIRPSRR